MTDFLQALTGWLEECIKPDKTPAQPTVLSNSMVGSKIGGLSSIDFGTGSPIADWVKAFQGLGDSTLQQTLLVRCLQMHLPRLAELFTLIGIIDIKWNGSGDHPESFTLNRERLHDFLSQPGKVAYDQLAARLAKPEDLKALQILLVMAFASPEALLDLEYRHQGVCALPLKAAPGSDLADVMGLVHSPIGIGLPFAQPLPLADFKAVAIADPQGAIGVLTIDAPSAQTPVSLKGLCLEFRFTAASTPVAHPVAYSAEIRPAWKIKSTAAGPASVFKIVLGENGVDAANSSAEGISAVVASSSPVVIGNAKGGTCVEMSEVTIGLQARGGGSAPIFDVVVSVPKINCHVAPDFLQVLAFGIPLPRLTFETEINVCFVQGAGLPGQGHDGGDVISIPVPVCTELRIGAPGAGLTIERMLTRIQLQLKPPGNFGARAVFEFDVSASFGPLHAIMTGAGVSLGHWSGGTLQRPRGIGLSLEAGPVSGGGFLECCGDDEFSGALQIKVLGLGAFAFGIYGELPGGGSSFVALIGLRLPIPGIQLGFGFAISGFGGLVGVNRRADTDTLRERLASGAAASVLFNENPERNAPRLFGDMRLFFPEERDVFVIGPTLQINWLVTVLKLDLGIFIELPGPRKIVIAGSGRLVIGTEDASLVYLRMDVVGGVDTTKALVFLDGALVNSHVMGIFRITGGAALRLAYGDNGTFLLTIGGFHPSFDPQGVDVPRVARVGVSVNLPLVWLKQEMYIAITPATFQLGAKVEAGIEIGPISSHGWFVFDALVSFDPASFVARIAAGFDVSVGGQSFYNVLVIGVLSGPGPLVLRAEASVRVLFIKVAADVTLTLCGGARQTQPVPKPLEVLSNQFRNPASIRGEGEDQSVIVRQFAATGNYVRPGGAIIWTQKVCPLDLDIWKFDGADLHAWYRIGIICRHQHEAVNEWFNSGLFLPMTDAQALNSTRFSWHKAGVRIDPRLVSGPQQTPNIGTTLIMLPDRNQRNIQQAGLAIVSGLASVLSERAGGARPEAGHKRVVVKQERWTHHSATVIENAKEALNPTQAFAVVKRWGGIAFPATTKPLSLEGVIGP